LVEIGEEKGLPRATFKYHKIEEYERGRGCLKSPFDVIKIIIKMGE
jgi:hypothetical protein